MVFCEKIYEKINDISKVNKDDIGKVYEQLKYIDGDKVKEIHDEAIKIGEAWNNGIRDEGSLFYLVELLNRMIERKEDMITMAARIMAFIIKEHPFWDGNHRTAFEMAQLILRAFGYEIKVDREEAKTFIRSIDRPDIKEKTIKKWMKKKIQPI